jgi:hypothetical protein
MAERAMLVSVGALELSKCFWYLIQWPWDSKNIPYMMSSKKLPSIHSITQGADTDTPIMIQLLDPSESHCTPGVHLNPMGTHDTQLLELMKQA